MPSIIHFQINIYSLLQREIALCGLKDGILMEICPRVLINCGSHEVERSITVSVIILGSCSNVLLISFRILKCCFMPSGVISCDLINSSGSNWPTRSERLWQSQSMIYGLTWSDGQLNRVRTAMHSPLLSLINRKGWLWHHRHCRLVENFIALIERWCFMLDCWWSTFLH